jgi:hypothetical protein
MHRRFIRVAAALGAVLLLTVASAHAGSVPRFSTAVELRVGLYPSKMVAADLNADGDADLATADIAAATVSVLFGTGTGNFRKRTAYRTARIPIGIALAEVEGDGDPDLVTVSRNRAGSIAVFVNDGSGRFLRAGTYGSGSKDAYAVASGDINRDGRTDLVTAHDTRDHLTVLMGEPGTHFRHTQSYQGPGAMDVALGDLNGDGALDATLACRNGSLVVRLGLGDGTFGPAISYRSGSGPFGIGLADFNHDDRLDVAVANHVDSSLSAFVGLGDGTVGERTPYRMSDRRLRYVDAVLIADFDRDGNLDVATPGNRGAAVRRGHGDGTFLNLQKVDPAPRVGATQGGAVADFNGDGWPDIAVNVACLDAECFEETHLALVYLNWSGQSAPPCVVPLTRGNRLREARRRIRRAGCRAGRVRYRSSRTAPKGQVIQQRPGYTAVLPSHGRVDLVVSRGRRR